MVPTSFFSSRKDSPQSSALFSYCLVKLRQRINSDQRASTAARNPPMGRERRRGVDNKTKNVPVNLFPRKQIGVVSACT